MSILINLVYIVGLVLFSPRIIVRMITHRRYRRGWSQRWGRISRKNPDNKCIWIHAVSVGEVNATRTIVAAIEQRLPNYDVAVSSTTDTGYDRAMKLYADRHDVFFFPADFSLTMARAIRHINPAAILLMELEVWPNLVKIADKRDIPVLVVNGRLSEKSFPRYKLIRPFVSRMFQKVTLFLVQSAEYAERFKALGAPPHRVIITNSLKYDTARTTDHIEGTNRLKRQINLTEPERLLVAGGTGPGEERIILDLFKMLRADNNTSDLRLALVPRKPERFDEVEFLIQKANLEYVRYSELKNTGKILENKPAVILGDTMGDLTKFYCAATLVFVGRSMVPMGGSDMMEAAALGKCVLFGPHTFNFKQTVDALLEKKGALQVHDIDQLFIMLKKCLNQPQFASEIAARGRQVIKDNQGATARTLQALTHLLQGDLEPTE